MKPIIFSTPMVQAILAGRKTQTRRVVKEDRRGEWAAVNGVRNNSEYGASVPCYLHRETAVDDISRNIMYPKYDVGDILWVRETWSPVYVLPKRHLYKADGEAGEGANLPIKWHPSTHMPKVAARIFLRVTGVRAERVQEITLSDIEREGLYCDPPYIRDHFAYAPGMRKHWRMLWDSINAKRGYGWDTNPWVWVYSFERVDKPAGWPGGEVEG